MTAGLFDTGALSPAKCRDIVRAFRRTYVPIQALWQWLDRAARQSISGCAAERLGLQIRSDGGEMQAVLPSSRVLRYPKLRLDSAPRTIRYLDDNGSEAEFTPDEPTLVYAVSPFTGPSSAKT